MTEDTGQGRAPWRITDALIVVFAGLLGSWVATVAVAPDFAEDGFTVLQLFGVVLVAQDVMIFGTVWVLSAKLAEPRRLLRLRPTPQDYPGVLIGLAFSLAVVAGYWLAIRLGLDIERQEVVGAAEQAENGAEWLAVAVSVVLLGPLAEEIAFRGVLLKALQERFSDTAAVYVSAVVFGAIHLLGDAGALYAVPASVLLGIVLARLTIATDRLGMAILTHAGFNLFSVLVIALT